jgi:hypothetical protein
MQNITELRTSLADNYTKMKANKMGINLGKELANTAGKIINSLKVELEYNSLMGIKEVIPFLQKTKDESSTS